jgi:hypothetical protein
MQILKTNEQILFADRQEAGSQACLDAHTSTPKCLQSDSKHPKAWVRGRL